MLKPYQENVQQIKNEIVSIAQEVVRANQEAMEVFKAQDFEAIASISIGVKKLANRAHEIDNLIVKTLALYSPEAKDLREMVAFLKITNELIRASTNTKTFLKGFKRSFSDEMNVNAILEYIVPLQRASTNALEITIEMLQDENSFEANYNKVLVEESKTDDLYAMIEKNILKLISKNLELSKDYFDLLSAFRRIEKSADRAASIANLLHYAYAGGEIK